MDADMRVSKTDAICFPYMKNQFTTTGIQHRRICNYVLAST